MEEQEVTPGTDENEQEIAAEPERPSKDLLDRTWDFFASVPIATLLIFIIAAASVGGSLITQENMTNDWRPAAEFYPARYGAFWGNVLFKTGMTRMYTSWWFMGLLYMLGASLTICSIERFVPLWKAVQHPNPTPPESFVKHLKNRFEYRTKESDPLAPLEAHLKANRYKVIRVGDRLYADKGRWGRWGPYVLHVGLILILAGAMMRVIPNFYMDQFIWVRDGEIVKVPDSNWYVRNDKFTVDTYENGQPKAYMTDATIIEDGKDVDTFTISMNTPLFHRWVELYQSSYKQELGTAKVNMTDRKSGNVLGTFEVNLIQPERKYVVEGYTINVTDYFPDFGMDNGKPVSRSSEVRNPGLVLDITGPDGKTYKNWYFVMYPEMEFDPTTPVKLATADMGVVSTTGLKVKKDLGIPVIYFGLIVASIAVCYTFYLAHRRYWAMVDGSRVVVGGWTNRNQGSFQNEMLRLANKLDPKTNTQTDYMEGEER